MELNPLTNAGCLMQALIGLLKTLSTKPSELYVIVQTSVAVDIRDQLSEPQGNLTVASRKLALELLHYAEFVELQGFLSALAADPAHHAAVLQIELPLIFLHLLNEDSILNNHQAALQPLFDAVFEGDTFSEELLDELLQACRTRDPLEMLLAKGEEIVKMLGTAQCPNLHTWLKAHGAVAPENGQQILAVRLMPFERTGSWKLLYVSFFPGGHTDRFQHLFGTIGTSLDELWLVLNQALWGLKKAPRLIGDSEDLILRIEVVSSAALWPYHRAKNSEEEEAWEVFQAVTIWHESDYGPVLGRSCCGTIHRPQDGQHSETLAVHHQEKKRYKSPHPAMLCTEPIWTHTDRGSPALTAHGSKRLLSMLLGGTAYTLFLDELFSTRTWCPVSEVFAAAKRWLDAPEPDNDIRLIWTDDRYPPLALAEKSP